MKRGMKNFVLLKIHLASGKKTLMWKHSKEEVMRERERERERESIQWWGKESLLGGWNVEEYCKSFGKEW